MGFNTKVGVRQLTGLKVGARNVLALMAGEEQVFPPSPVVLTYTRTDDVLDFEEITIDEAGGKTYYESYNFDADEGLLTITENGGG